MTEQYHIPGQAKVEILSSPEEKEQTRILDGIRITLIVIAIMLFLILAFTMVAVFGG